MLTHCLPELYADSDRFDPDHFAPARAEDKKHPFVLIGFGSGPHSCLCFEFDSATFSTQLGEATLVAR